MSCKHPHFNEEVTERGIYPDRLLEARAGEFGRYNLLSHMQQKVVPRGLDGVQNPQDAGVDESTSRHKVGLTTTLREAEPLVFVMNLFAATAR